MVLKRSAMKLMTTMLFSQNSLSDITSELETKVMPNIKNGIDILEIDIVEAKTPTADSKVVKEILSPILTEIKNLVKSYHTEICVCVRSTEVAKFALEQGVDMIHDFTGFVGHDCVEVAQLISKSGTKVILHYVKPAMPCIKYHKVDGFVDNVISAMKEKVNFLLSYNIGAENIFLDPTVCMSHEELSVIFKSVDSFWDAGVELCFSCYGCDFSQTGSYMFDNTPAMESVALTALLHARGVRLIRCKDKDVAAIKHSVELLEFSEKMRR